MRGVQLVNLLLSRTFISANMRYVTGPSYLPKYLPNECAPACPLVEGNPECARESLRPNVATKSDVKYSLLRENVTYEERTDLTEIKPKRRLEQSGRA